MNYILFNGKVVTMNKDIPQVSAVGIKDNKIEAVGTDEAILGMKNSETKLIDLKGKLVLPGFNDSHMHLLNFGYTLTKADLIEAKSIKNMIEIGKKYLDDKKISSGKWILGRGWNQDCFDDGQLPTRHDLDKISTEHPILFTRACGHIGVANTRALMEADIYDHIPSIEGGKIDRDYCGKASGILREKALEFISRKIPNPTLKEIKDMILKASEYASSMGITSVGTDDFSALPQNDPELVIKAFTELNKEGNLNLRINEQCLIHDVNYLKEFIKKGYNTGWTNGHFKIGPLKLLTDGSLGARTAFMKDEYVDCPGNFGIPYFAQEELDALIDTAHKNNMQIATHCIGDGALEMVFNSMEKAYKKWGIKNLRHGIVHCQIMDKHLLERFKKLNMGAYVQPIFIDYDHKIVEKRVGRSKTETSYNFKTLMDMGVHVSGGSDCPVEPCDVLPNIYCAVTRKGLDGLPENGFLPAQRVSVHEAVEMFTKEGSYITFEEEIKGQIQKGMVADMIILDKDIFDIPLGEIKDVQVKMTIFDGEIVFSR
ncbi:MAG: amidohydrolase [Maledivibacter sp.]|nr:amidohydrolase [Maledivibacter sp.]